MYRFYRSQVPFLSGMRRTLGELPIRPPQLDSHTHVAGREDARARDGHPPTPRQHAASAPSPSSEPIPCPQCGYDLRASIAGERCPECGGTVPKVQLVRLREVTRRDLRVDFARAWNQLGFLALPPAFLLSPIPCLMPFGVSVSIALGFAPAFRMMALRAFDTLPDELRALSRDKLARLRRVQKLEFVCVGFIAMYAALATFGGAPRSAWNLYFATVLAWWCIAAAGIGAQVRLGQQLATWLRADLDRYEAERASREGSTPERDREAAARAQTRCEVPDEEETAKLLRQNGIAFCCVVAGAVLFFMASMAQRVTGVNAVAITGNAGATSTTSTVVWMTEMASNLIFACAFFLFGLVALKARAHADMVAMAVHGSRLGRVTPVARPTAQRSTSVAHNTDDLNLPPDWKPPPTRTPPPDDDSPIPLA